MTLQNAGLNKETQVNDDSFDVFLSYCQDTEDKMATFYDTLSKNYGLKLRVDGTNGVKLTEYLLKSKVFVCCLSKSYASTRKCIHEITMAYTNDKPIIALFFENLPDNPEIRIYLEKSIRFNFYEDPKIATKWRGSMFDSFVLALGNMVDKKLGRKSIKKSKFNFLNERVSSFAPIFGKAFGDGILKQPLNAIDEADKKITDHSGMNTIEQKIEKMETEMIVEAKCIKMEKFKSNSLFEIISGFNRIVCSETRNKVYITSSYNKSIVMVDSNGNWIERRNPNGLLDQPWGICISENEIFIGDNGKRCIFVFDHDLKHLRTLGEGKIDGFYDLALDSSSDSVYVASLYDSIVAIFDTKTGELKRKILISTPTFISIKGNKIAISSASDYIFVLNKDDFTISYVIKCESLKYMNGLHLQDDGAIFTIAYLFDGSNSSSKTSHVYLCCFKRTDRGIRLKKLNIGVNQVNDFVIMSNRFRFFCICDTHIDVFDHQLTLRNITSY